MPVTHKRTAQPVQPQRRPETKETLLEALRDALRDAPRERVRDPQRPYKRYSKRDTPRERHTNLVILLVLWKGLLIFFLFSVGGHLQFFGKLRKLLQITFEHLVGLQFLLPLGLQVLLDLFVGWRLFAFVG